MTNAPKAAIISPYQVTQQMFFMSMPTTTMMTMTLNQEALLRAGGRD